MEQSRASTIFEVIQTTKIVNLSKYFFLVSYFFYTLNCCFSIPIKVLKFRCAGVGTVGAVVVDKFGRVACATSTGGTTGKLPGRLGDTPIPGSGGYAKDSVGAVSATGRGESIMRICLSNYILNLMEQGMLYRNNHYYFSGRLS